jgi:hypothetical protein
MLRFDVRSQHWNGAINQLWIIEAACLFYRHGLLKKLVGRHRQFSERIPLALSMFPVIIVFETRVYAKAHYNIALSFSGKNVSKLL